MPIALSESSPRLDPSASANDLAKATRAAELAGWRVIHLDQAMLTAELAEDAFAHVAAQSEPTLAVWIGYIPLPADYAAVQRAAAARHIHLVHSVDQYRDAEEFDRFYPRLGELTPRSWTVDSLPACDAIAADLPYPVFLKGAIQSLKHEGLDACRATDATGLRARVARLLNLERRSQGRVIIRELRALRHSREAAGNFPAGREYRLFLYRGEILAMGYYWEHDDPLAPLDRDEDRQVRALAVEAARRVGVPYLAVDIGQTEAGDWIVIEVGDGQFSGLSQASPQQLWHRLGQALSSD